ncbi:MAG: PucR family transcriptional regulator ligand-binding domain-containing protein [Actinomycetes bacterium]
MSLMAITVAELLDMPHLRLRLHSGAKGVDRKLAWTHTSDLPEPWQWITGGELLLTNGMSFPADGPGQQELVERLVKAGASALAIGEQMYCPPLTEQFAEASNRLGFSVLLVEFPMPFVSISKTVAAANMLEQSDQLIRTEQIYQTLQRMVNAQTESSAITSELAQILGCKIHVCHRESAQPWYPSDPHLDPLVAEALRHSNSRSLDVLAGAFAVPLRDGRELRLVDVPTQPSAVLALEMSQPGILDAILIQHAVTVIALEMAQSLVRIEHERRFGADLLFQLMEGRGDARSIRRQLMARGINITRAVVVTITSPDVAKLRELHTALWRNRIRNLVALRRGVLYVLCVDEQSVHDVVRASVSHDALIGISASVKSIERVPEALREATWAERAAAGVPGLTFHYGDRSPLFGIANIEDAKALVTRTLGALINYEQAHASDLLQTLEAFFENQRSWQKTADSLHVHRQTVLYRIRKIEEISGYDLSATRDIAELWLALQARSLIGVTDIVNHARSGS